MDQTPLNLEYIEQLDCQFDILTEKMNNILNEYCGNMTCTECAKNRKEFIKLEVLSIDISNTKRYIQLQLGGVPLDENWEAR